MGVFHLSPICVKQYCVLLSLSTARTLNSLEYRRHSVEQIEEKTNSVSHFFPLLYEKIENMVWVEVTSFWGLLQLCQKIENIVRIEMLRYIQEINSTKFELTKEWGECSKANKRKTSKCFSNNCVQKREILFH